MLQFTIRPKIGNSNKRLLSIALVDSAAAPRAASPKIIKKIVARGEEHEGLEVFKKPESKSLFL